VNFFTCSGREAVPLFAQRYAFKLLSAEDRSLLARYLVVVVKTPRLNNGALATKTDSRPPILSYL
jgi:hypothetical protein